MASKYATEDLDSDEIVEMYCELCKKKGKHRIADGFCVNCVKYFCKDCLSYHTEFLPDHVHKDKTNMPQDVCLNPCPSHSEDIIKFYCSSCNMFFCSECKKNGHNECKNVHHLPDLVKDLEKGTEFLNLGQDLDAVVEESQIHVSVLSEAKKLMEAMCSAALSEIDSMRDQLIEYINRSVGTIKSDLKSIENAEMKTIQDNCSKLSALISETSSMKSKMDQKVRECKRCELFMAMKDMQTKQKALQQKVLEMKRHKLRDFEFEANSSIKSLMKNHIPLGNLVFKQNVGTTCIKEESAQMSKSMVDIPDVETQKSFVANQLQKPLIEGETWYIIDIKWFKQWKSYVGYENRDRLNVGEELAYPGPIDNTPILQEGTDKLKEHLIDNLDYSLIPGECWEMLLSWYGLLEGQKPLPRKVIEEGVYGKSLKVEVYPWHLKIYDNSKPDDVITKTFSRSDTVRKLEEVMRREFSIPNDKEVRLWNMYMTNMYEQLADKDKTLQEAGLYQGQVIVIEQKNPDGSWPKGIKK
ncbi:E3 ubiquitin-protein ligase TRIM36-like isoform X2 [Ruditapes philippinarum]|uniref:E3 ubiquitin-protein ligase TRIM36-like isoform X2 n=1 Tax=Ruditapes philippinarum TaxID=129788 RepID=UPI00295BA371|nr:E3 ubiquitin-protein ligase TRIM36-like isoform X2 [Ruditapes philippinarum]